MKAQLYINWLLIINTLFVEQTSHKRKPTSSPKILATILLCGGDLRSRARQGKRSSFTDVHFRTSTYNKFVQKPKLFFFVILKVCWTVCVFHFLNLESLKRIYASPFTFRDFRNRCTMKLLKVEQILKSWKGTLQRVNAFFTKLLSKMWTDNVVKTIYCQRNLIFLWQKKL